jgi:hypothetical protein
MTLLCNQFQRYAAVIVSSNSIAVYREEAILRGNRIPAHYTLLLHYQRWAPGHHIYTSSFELSGQLFAQPPSHAGFPRVGPSLVCADAGSQPYEVYW